MLTFENVEVQQGDFHLSANFSVASGQTVAIIGPSGAGKSTLLNVVAGFTPARGRVVMDGTDISSRAPGDRPVSMVFQDSNLFPHLTVFQNVALGIRPSLRLKGEEPASVSAALDQVGLSGYDGRKPAALSGGQQSRVALARILLRRRPYLLLDEPFAALGPALRGEMLSLVGQIAKDNALTVLMVTHDPGDARRIADQAILVADGMAQPPVKVDSFFANPPDALKNYLGT